MLTDSRIQQAVHWGDLEISGFNDSQLQPASYDIRLHDEALQLRPGLPLDPRENAEPEFERVLIPESGAVLRGRGFLLCSTAERVRVGPGFVGQVEGKSSLGRLGLMVHATAGYIDPGFDGQITLELSCVHDRGVKIYPGMRIGQLAFRYCGSGDRLYEGKYQGQEGPTASRYHQNWDALLEQWR
jgi:dCTP deaminase